MLVPLTLQQLAFQTVKVLLRIRPLRKALKLILGYDDFFSGARVPFLAFVGSITLFNVLKGGDILFVPVFQYAGSIIKIGVPGLEDCPPAGFFNNIF